MSLSLALTFISAALILATALICKRAQGERLMCTFPRCGQPATTTNRADQETCTDHQLVVVGICGPESCKHEDDGGDS